jgi:predicted DNA-binding protein (UPF0251 family)
MSTTKELINGREAWRLVHDERRSTKQAAARLAISISDVFDLLAKERARREIAAHRAAALGLTQTAT